MRVAWLAAFFFVAITASAVAQSAVPADSAIDSLPRDILSDPSVRSFSMDTVRFGFDWTTMIDQSLNIARSLPPSHLVRLGDFRPIDLDSAVSDEPTDSVRHSVYLAVRWQHYWRELCTEIRFTPDGREYYEQFRRTKPTYVKGSISFNALQ